MNTSSKVIQEFHELSRNTLMSTRQDLFASDSQNHKGHSEYEKSYQLDRIKAGEQLGKGVLPDIFTTYLSYLLYNSYSEIASIHHLRKCMRVTPSAGALYPVELYLHSLSDESDALYKYNPKNHSLFFDDQNTVGLSSSFSLILAMNVKNSVKKYKARSLRLILLDIGHFYMSLCVVAQQFNIGIRISPFNRKKTIEKFPSQFSYCLRKDIPIMSLQIDLNSNPPKQATIDTVSSCKSQEINWDQYYTNASNDELTYVKALQEIAESTAKLDQRKSFSFKLYPDKISSNLYQRRSTRIFDTTKSIDSGKFFSFINSLFQAAMDLQTHFETVDGPLYSVIIVSNVDTLDPGLYLFIDSSTVKELRQSLWVKHAWQKILESDSGLVLYKVGSLPSTTQMLKTLFLNQQCAYTAAANVIFFSSSTHLFSPQKYFLSHFLAGIIGQQAYLMALERGLGITGIGGVNDDAMDDLFKSQNETYSCIYSLAVGVDDSARLQS